MLNAVLSLSTRVCSNPTNKGLGPDLGNMPWPKRTPIPCMTFSIASNTLFITFETQTPSFCSFGSKPCIAFVVLKVTGASMYIALSVHQHRLGMNTGVMRSVVWRRWLRSLLLFEGMCTEGRRRKQGHEPVFPHQIWYWRQIVRANLA